MDTIGSALGVVGLRGRVSSTMAQADCRHTFQREFRPDVCFFPSFFEAHSSSRGKSLPCPLSPKAAQDPIFSLSALVPFFAGWANGVAVPTSWARAPSVGCTRGPANPADASRGNITRVLHLLVLGQQEEEAGMINARDCGSGCARGTALL